MAATPVPTPTRVGAAIAHHRRRRRLTGHQLAAELGMSQSTITGWETGVRAVSLVTLWRVADALRVDPFDLLDFNPARSVSWEDMTA